MVFSPDGSRVASTHGNHNIYITDIRTGKHIRTLIGHPRTPWCIAFHPTSDQIVASGCLGGQVRIWDLSVSVFFFLIYYKCFIFLLHHDLYVHFKRIQKIKIRATFKNTDVPLNH